MEGALEDAKAALAKSKDNMTKYYDQRQTPTPNYKPGDKVYLDASDIHTNRPLRKLFHCRLGPFPIVKKVGNRAYQLQLPLSMSRLHPVFNWPQPQSIQSKAITHWYACCVYRHRCAQFQWFIPDEYNRNHAHITSSCQELSICRHEHVCKNVSILDSFFPPPPFAYSYWVVFSLNIKVDWQSEQVFCELFTKMKLACHLVFVFVCSSKLSRIWGSLTGTEPVVVIG